MLAHLSMGKKWDYFYFKNISTVCLSNGMFLLSACVGLRGAKRKGLMVLERKHSWFARAFLEMERRDRFQMPCLQSIIEGE